MAKQNPSNALKCVEQAKVLCAWFKANYRNLPWREHYHFYEVLVSEFMLQQTQIKTALPFFQRWMARFENLEALAQTPLEEVMPYWQGLGYYRRCKMLHQCAKQLQSLKEVPQSIEALERLPGIGNYTACALVAIAFNQPAIVLDGNVKRLWSRLLGFDGYINSAEANHFFKKTQKQWLGIFAQDSTITPRELNQALMEFGALVCTRKNPKCKSCVLQKDCQAYHNRKSCVEDFGRMKPQTYRHQTLVLLALPSKNGGWLLEKSLNDKASQLNKRKAWWDGLMNLPYLSFSGKLDKKEMLDQLNLSSLYHQNQSGIKITPPFSHLVTQHKLTCFTLVCWCESLEKKLAAIWHFDTTQSTPSYQQGLAISRLSQKALKSIEGFEGRKN